MSKAFYSEKQLIQKLGISRSTIWRMRRAGEFPNPVGIGMGGRVGYPAAMIDEWIAARLEGQAA